VTVGGLHTVCLEIERHVPSAERIYDVTDNLAGVPPDRASLIALRALLSGPVASGTPARFVLQTATWAITDGISIGADDAALLRAVGLDPSALPTGFPDLPSPNAGSSDPRAYRLAGLLGVSPSPVPPTTEECPGTQLERAACLLERVETLAAALPAEAAKPKLRAKIRRQVDAVRAKIAAALRATKPRKADKLKRAAARRALALVRMLGKAASKKKLRDGEASELRDAVSAVAGAIA
jgi:hypothetical protein